MKKTTVALRWTGMRFCIFLLVLAQAAWSVTARAQDAPPSPAAAPSNSAKDQQTEQPPADNDQLTMFPNHQWKRFWISGQANLIEQGAPPFPALYSGAHSFTSQGTQALSRIFTLYTVTRLTKYSDVVFDVEEASGSGVSGGVGMAGYPNIDVVRLPGEGLPLTTAPYVARLIFRQVIPLGHEREEAEAGPMSMLTSLPTKRLEIRLGNFSLADFLDVNAVGSDSHLQFMNWAVVNNGAWDYAADTRGYTWGGMVELHASPTWSLRFVEALMPKVANGIDLQWNLRLAHASNLQLELLPHILANRHTAIRVLAYRNIADMGNYRQSINEFLQGQTPTPEITATRQNGRSKNGVGLNAEQELTPRLRAYLRAGWNDGRNESFCYTEVDRTLALGADYLGDRWHRKHDKVGAVFVLNGISGAHAQYLALGGLGFILGDGALTYGRERIVESYYTAHIWRGIFGALDLQHITNPGYNQARGPAWVAAARLHVDF